MTRGGDLTLTLVLKNIELNQIAKVRATVEQNRGDRTGDDIEVTKEGSVTYDEDGVPTEDEDNEVNFDFENNAVILNLDQKETFMFESGTAEIQLRMTSIYGKIIPTVINKIRVNPTLDVKVL